MQASPQYVLTAYTAPQRRPVRHWVSSADLFGVPHHRTGMRTSADVCGNWQKNGGVSAFSGCKDACHPGSLRTMARGSQAGP